MKNKIKALIELFMKTKIVLLLNSIYKGFFKVCEIPLEKLDKSSYKSKISKYYRNNPKMDYLFLVLVIIIISLVLFRGFIFGDYVFIFNEKDLNPDHLCNYYPYTDHIFHHKEGLSFWSFNSGMGNNMFPMFYQFYLDPFNLINSLFWNPMDDGIIYMLILKLICASLLFYKFILYIVKSRFSAFLTAVLFSFNGFVMLMGQHYSMVNRVFAFVLLLYAIEVYFVSKNKWILILAFFINLTDFYFFYQSMFFVCFYLIFRNIYTRNKIKNIFTQIIQLLPYGLIGLLIASVFFLPIMYVIISGPRLDLEKFNLTQMIFSLNTFEYYLSLFGAMFSMNLSGNYLNYFGWFDYMAPPQVYSGLITVLLIPQIFYLKEKHEKKALFFLAGVTILTLLFPFFSYLFNGFQEFYLRWVYCIITFNLITIAFILKSIITDKTLNVKLLNLSLGVITIGLMLFLLYYRRHDGEWMTNKLTGNFYANKNLYIRNKLIVILCFLVLYFILLQFFNRFKVVIGVLLIMLISSELIIEHYPTYFSRGLVKKDRNPYRSEFAKNNAYLINKIKKNDKEPFYRIEQQYYLFNNNLARNTSLALNYYGLKSYTSLNSKSTYDFCRYFNLIGQGHWANVLPSWEPDIKRYSLLNILSIKYLISKEKIENRAYELIDKSKGLLVYKNNDFIPLGTSFDKFISESQMKKYSDSIKDSLVNSCLIVDDNDIVKTRKYFNLTKLKSKFKITKFSNSLIKGHVLSSCKKMLYFSIPYDKGWKIKVNGREVDFFRVNIGFIGIPIEKGTSNIELKYNPPMLNIGLIISLTTIFGCFLFFIFSKKRNLKMNLNKEFENGQYEK